MSTGMEQALKLGPVSETASQHQVSQPQALQRIRGFMSDFSIETTPGAAAWITDCAIAGVHMSPLGGLSNSTRWAYAASRGEIRMHENGQGFDVIETQT